MLPLAARGLAVLPRPRSAARAPSSSSSAAPAARPVAVRAAAKSSSPAGASSAAYDEDKDDDVIAGRRLAVTRMTVVQIKDEARLSAGAGAGECGCRLAADAHTRPPHPRKQLEKLGASTLGLRTDLAARLGAERAAQMHAKGACRAAEGRLRPDPAGLRIPRSPPAPPSPSLPPSAQRRRPPRSSRCPRFCSTP